MDAARNKVESDHKKKIAKLKDGPIVRANKTFGEAMDIPLDFVAKVNKGLKFFLMGLLMIFVLAYSVVAAGFY